MTARRGRRARGGGVRDFRACAAPALRAQRAEPGRSAPWSGPFRRRPARRRRSEQAVASPLLSERFFSKMSFAGSGRRGLARPVRRVTRAALRGPVRHTGATLMLVQSRKPASKREENIDMRSLTRPGQLGLGEIRAGSSTAVTTRRRRARPRRRRRPPLMLDAARAAAVWEVTVEARRPAP